MDARTLGDVLRFIAEFETLSQVEDAFPDSSLPQVRAAITSLANQISQPMELPSQSEETGPKERILLKTDGGSRGNPGPAGAGWVLFDSQGTCIARGNEFLGRRTNNEAEYAAVLLGLQAVINLGYSKVDLRLDSELLVKQIKGVYRVKKAHLKPLHEEACRLLGGFDDYSVAHVYRKDNSEADEQANVAMDRGH